MNYSGNVQEKRKYKYREYGQLGKSGKNGFCKRFGKKAFQFASQLLNVMPIDVKNKLYLRLMTNC